MKLTRQLFADDLDPNALWSILEESTSGSFRWSPRQGAAWSSKLYATLGYSEEEDPTEQLPGTLVHPEDRERYTRLLDETRRAGSRYLLDLRLQHRDGSYSWFEIRGFWLDRNDDDRAVLIGSVDDISTRRSLQQELERRKELFDVFFENCPAAVYVKNRDSRHVYGNSAAGELVGCSQEEFVGSLTSEVFDEESAKRLTAVDQDVLANRETRTWLGEITLDNGETRQLFDTKFPITDPRSHEPLVGGFGVDITRERSMERALARSQRMDALGQLVGGVAHDFNNTLAVIRGSLELVANDPSGNVLTECLEEMSAAVERGARLNRQLLAYGRRAPLKPDRLDVNRVLEEMWRLIRRTLPANIEIAFEAGVDLWCAHADRAQLENVVLNLTLNARDAMAGGGLLDITTSNLELGEDDATSLDPELAAGRYVLVEVRDTGSGIPTELLDRVFEPFFTTKPFGEGSGMGLPMVYGSMKQIGGTVRISSSDLDRGALVSLYLPASRSGPVLESDADSSSLVGGSETIVLVEDDASVRRTMQRQLHSLGYRVVEATSAHEALTQLESGLRTALVITDHDLPGELQGADLARRLRARDANLPILVVSGYEQVARSDALLGDAVETLVKPVSLPALAQAVRSAIDSR